MPDAPRILALDQGTTSSRAILFTPDGHVLGSAQQEFTQHFPRPGRVEHDPLEIWNTQLATARRVLADTGTAPSAVAAIGITNQRETAVAWERDSGRPVGNAIVWQDRRTAGACDRLRGEGLEPLFRDRTGLLLDPYFSGTKWAWMLEHNEGLRPKAERGEVLFGTVDAWLIWNLTGGRLHATDASNASRTLVCDTGTGTWSDDLARALDLPLSALPEIRDSAGDFGTTDPKWFDGVSIPIRGVAGDQQAALFGQACFEPGMAKNTYGTGCFLLWQKGTERPAPPEGLLSTVAWRLDGRLHYALEGSVFVGGAAVQWLRDGLRIIDPAEDTAWFASRVPDSGGVVVVPAFAGLGAPHWDPYARGGIFGLTRGSTKNHLIRATLEALAFQTRDLLGAMAAGEGPTELRVDGGAAANDLLMQLQADLLDRPVVRPGTLETTALGAAFLAALAAGLTDLPGISAGWREDRRFLPGLDADERARRLRRWDRAVERCRGWLEDGDET